MQGVILAGGKGTRLAHITSVIPKPMVEIGGKPVLEHQISLLARYNIKDIIILVNHLKDSIIDYFKDGSQWNVSIRYLEEKEPLGTVGGIKEIEPLIKGDFLVLYGDVMMDLDLTRLMSFHVEKKSEYTLVLHPNDHPYDSDLVEIDKNSKVVGFHSKPHTSGQYYRNLVNAGLYILSPSIFSKIEKGKKADFGKDVFPHLFKTGKMFGYNTTEYLKDMGTPDRLKKVEQDYTSGKIHRRNLAYPQKAIFLDRDGVINPDKDLISRVEDLELFDNTCSAIKKINNSDYLAIVATNQSVVARNLCSEEGLQIIHNKLDTLLGEEGAKLDAIYYCPHHPDKGFPGENPSYKVACECRKPKPGMLLQASKDFNIDLPSSYFIGDAQRDIEAGIKAGVTTIGVMSGKGLRDTKVLPDFFFKDIEEAVNFIMHNPYEDQCRTILKEVVQAEASPFIILIGGNSRSGKSTLATSLQKLLMDNNLSVLRIDLDNWIVPSQDREAHFTVFDNFQLPQLRQDIQNILAGKPIKSAGYAQHPERKAVPKSYCYTNERVVIVEGVVALADKDLNALAHIKIFKDIDIAIFKERFYDFYRWKSMNEKDIDLLYEHRVKNEYYPIVESTKSAATVVI